MDNLNINNPRREGLGKPVSFNDDAGGTNISHSPLDLGGGSAVEVPKAEEIAQPIELAEKKPVEQKPVEKAVSPERITGVKTFFTKLHTGAMEFLDEQITSWLKDNPGITIKRTNMITGEIQGKKTEPNIIITVWY